MSCEKMRPQDPWLPIRGDRGTRRLEASRRELQMEEMVQLDVHMFLLHGQRMWRQHASGFLHHFDFTPTWGLEGLIIYEISNNFTGEISRPVYIYMYIYSCLQVHTLGTHRILPHLRQPAVPTVVRATQASTVFADRVGPDHNQILLNAYSTIGLAPVGQRHWHDAASSTQLFRRRRRTC